MPGSPSEQDKARLRIVLGRREFPAGEGGELAVGDVLELDSPADGPVEVYVDDRLIGRGVPVEVDGRLGVRMTEIVEGPVRPEER